MMENRPRMVKSTNNSWIVPFAIFSKLSYFKYFIKDSNKQEGQPVLQILEYDTIHAPPSPRPPIHTHPQVHYYGSNTGRDLNEERKSITRERMK